MGNGVFANHAHVFPERLNANGTVARLQKLMDECGIERQVCFAPFPHQWDDKTTTSNQWLINEIKGKSRFVGFGTIDFRRPDVRDQVKQARDIGLVGLKLHPNSQEFDILAPRAQEVYAEAEKQKLFCTFHSGVHQSRLKDVMVLKFDEVAWTFPDLRFSMEHVGGYHFFDEALAVIFNHVPPPWALDKKCNVFAGLASVFTQHQNRFWYLSPERIMELYRQVGPDQLIFGLDYPYNQERETKMGLETLRGMGWPAEDLAKALGGNLARELGLK